MKGYEIERDAERILKSEGYEIVIEKENERYLSLYLHEQLGRVQRVLAAISQSKALNNKLKKQFSLQRQRELESLIQRRELLEKDRKKNLELLKILGDDITPVKRQKLLYSLSRSQGYNGSFQDWLSKEVKENLGYPSYIDYFCEKRNRYFIFDIKYKEVINGEIPNKICFTNNEILNYARIIKETKVKVEIMIVAKISSRTSFKIFDWSEFIIPPKFDSHTTSKTSLRRVGGIDIRSFKMLN